MTTFVQLSARLKNFLRGWLLVLDLKEGLVECATGCVKSVVMLTNINCKQKVEIYKSNQLQLEYQPNVALSIKVRVATGGKTA